MAETKQYLDYDGLIKIIELIQVTFPTKQITAEALDQINQRLTELIDGYNNHSHTIEEQSLEVSYSNNKLVINSTHTHQLDAPSEEHQVETPLPLPEGLRPNGGGGSAVDYSKEYFTIEALEDGLTVQLSQNTSEYRIDNGEWNSLTANTTTPSINSGQKISFKITNPTISSSNGIGIFTVNKAFNVEGNIMSLLYENNFSDKTDLTSKDYAFYKLFYNCTTLQNAENLILPATILANYCYSYMFRDCTSLTTVPELPATTLTNYCYSGMFYSCTSLTTAPELPGTILASGCYRYMFQDCSNLNYIKMLATDRSASDCLSGWVLFVSSTGTFVKNAAMTSLPTGANGIPSGWTVQDA